MSLEADVAKGLMGLMGLGRCNVGYVRINSLKIDKTYVLGILISYNSKNK